jgi:hypothetical protein
MPMNTERWQAKKTRNATDEMIEPIARMIVGAMCIFAVGDQSRIAELVADIPLFLPFGYERPPHRRAAPANAPRARCRFTLTVEIRRRQLSH